MPSGPGYDPASRVRLPMSVVLDARLPHQAVRAWAKVRKLSTGQTGCTLGGEALAEQLRISPRTMDSAFSQLARCGLLRTEPRVTGRGSRPAGRWALTPAGGPSGFADMPIGLVDRLDAGPLRVLAVLVCFAVTGRPTTAEAAGLALDLSAEQVRVHCASLIRAGVLEVAQRQGPGARNVYRPRMAGLALDPGPAAGGEASKEEGRIPGAGGNCASASARAGGNCAPGAGESCASGAGGICAPPGKTIPEGERASRSPSRPAEGAGPPPRTGGRTRPGRHDLTPTTDTRAPAVEPVADDEWDRRRSAAADRAQWHDAPQRADVTAALGGLGELREHLTGWRRRAACVQVADLLDTGLPPERIALRIQRAADRLAERGEPVRDVYAFLRGMALVQPYGCRDPDCEDGRLWATGEPCRLCAERRRDRAAARRGPTGPGLGTEPGE